MTCFTSLHPAVQRHRLCFPPPFPLLFAPVLRLSLQRHNLTTKYVLAKLDVLGLTPDTAVHPSDLPQDAFCLFRQRGTITAKFSKSARAQQKKANPKREREARNFTIQMNRATAQTRTTSSALFCCFVSHIPHFLYARPVLCW